METIEAPYVTEQFRAVVGRLKKAPLGAFTYEDLKLLEWAIDIERQMADTSTGEYRLIQRYNDKGELLMREYRNAARERTQLTALGTLAEKVGV